MSKKLVFIDVDGTLASNHQRTHDTYARIPVSAINAIENLKQRGHLPIIATGRSYQNILQLLDQLSIDSAICSNGAYVVMKHQVISEHFMRYELVEEIVNIISPIKGINIIVETTEADYLLRSTEGEGLLFDPQTLPKIDNLSVLKGHDILQVIANGKNISDQLQLEHPDLIVKKFGPDAFDIALSHVNKGIGVHDVMEYLQISKQDTIAFGDEENDIEMFYSVGLSIAMGEASDDAKGAADRIASAVDDDGLAKMMKELNLID